MTKLDAQFLSYANYHTTKGNKITHYLGIPLIVLSTVGLMSLVKIGSIGDLGFILWGLSAGYYCSLDLRKGLLFSILLFGVYQISLGIPWGIHLSLFITGWIFQGIGHYVYEKKSPAFLTNLAHLLIGPFWIFDSLLKKVTKS